MKNKRLLQSASTIGLAFLCMAGSANAGLIISYTTNASGTEFVAGVNSDVLNSSGGAAATLTFIPNTNSNAGVPSNIDLGDFLLVCGTCSTSQTTTFGSFTFDLVVTDSTDGATGEFVGTSTGGTVSSNSSTIAVNWTSPANLQIGPGISHALSGSFGPTEFNLVSPVSLIVAPNSGTPPGDTTIQGQVSSAPEPMTFFLTGGALMGLGLLRRSKVRKA
jgi:hypothetical protein